jgi:putative transcriptional regulator
MLRIKLKYLMVDYKVKSIAELSRNVSINRNTLNKLANETNLESVKLETYLKLCDYFKCPLSDLIEYTPDKD